MKQFIVPILKGALAEMGIALKDEEIYKMIEIPPSTEMGDYAFPCFFLIDKLKQEPDQIALEIRSKIKKIPFEFESVQTVGPYINFFVNRKKATENLLREIFQEKENFGKQNIGQGKKALIEHTSINPNASPHVGRARNAIIGDSIVRIFKFLNFKTEVHYYINDVSKQIAMLVLACAEKLKFESMLKKYVEISKKVKKSKKIEKQVFEILQKFEQGNKEITGKFKKITQICVKGQEQILKELGIHYDFFDYESNYLKETKKIIEQLSKTKKLHKDKEGRLYIDQRGTSVTKKMKKPVFVLTRSDGTGLYPLRDIAYTIDKLKKANKNLIVLGEDQKLYFQQLKETLKLLGIEAPYAIHYSFILLKEGKKSKRMSTRKGEVVLLKDFIEDAIKKAKKEIEKRKTKGDAKIIGIGAVKYSILKNNPDKAIIFDLGEALSFEGNTGPYLQYSYARASSIIKKAKKKKSKEKENIFEIKELEDLEIKLLKKIYQFKETVFRAYNNLNSSLIANYSYQLAQIFNEFYHACPVIGSEKEAFRLSLVEAFRIVLKNSLSLLGIDVLEEM